MPDKKQVNLAQKPQKYKTEVLLKSRALSDYQTDFAKALLTKSAYTAEEARAELDQFFGKEGKK
ncbi:MAG: hypothetical protein KH366_13280 [Clostridiaceae bacterium]|nr:hypothetical protein [Clostridiaceae bacterium]